MVKSAEDEGMPVEDTFETAVEHLAGYSVVSVAGEVDVATAPSLRDRLDEALAEGPPLLVVDLLKVTFIDSTALGVLITARQQAETAGTGLRLVIAESRIIKIFEITGLTELFSIRPTRQEAVAG
jgi:anti-sigma B factor antagonist